MKVLCLDAVFRDRAAAGACLLDGAELAVARIRSGPLTREEVAR